MANGGMDQVANVTCILNALFVNAVMKFTYELDYTLNLEELI